MDGISDLTMRSLEYALGGVAARGDARAHNVANVSTPGYTSSTVRFEEALASALEVGGRPSAPRVVAQPGPVNANGNSVSLEDELLGAMKDGVLYETLTKSYAYKLDVLRTAIGRR